MAPPHSTARPTAMAASLTSGLLIAQQVVLKASRDSLFLSNFGVRWLPIATTVGAVVSAIVLLRYSRLLTRHSPARAIPRVLFAGSVLLVAEWAIGLRSERAAAVLIHLHSAVFGAAVISSFWSLVSETFDPHQARRYVGWVTAGAAIGGTIGGLATWALSSRVSGVHMLLAVAGLNAAAAISVGRIRSDHAPSVPSSPTPWTAGEPLRLLRASPLLRQLGLIVALVALLEVLLDYAVSFHAATTLSTGGRLLGFFALTHVVMSLGSLVLQVVLAQRSLERLGPVVTLLLLPLTVMVLGIAALVVPGLATSAILRGGEGVMRGSFFRSAYELFFSPLEERQKRAVKVLLDVGFDRVGVLVGSGVTALAIVAGARGSWLFGVATAVVTIVLLLAVHPLGKSYVTTLGSSVSHGTPGYDLVPLGVSRTHEEYSRAEVMKRIEEQNALLPRKQRLANEARLRDLYELRSGDPARIRVALERVAEFDAASRSELIGLLGSEVLHGEAEQAIAGVVVRMTGQLGDALGDPGLDDVLRRRVARILGQSDDARAHDALLAGLADPSERLRRACAAALVRIRGRDQRVEFPRERVSAAIRQSLSELQAESSPADERRLAHLFALFALIVSRDAPLEASLKALLSSDARLRGTALEFLHEVLPMPIRLEAWALVEAVASRTAAAGAAS